MDELVCFFKTEVGVEKIVLHRLEGSVMSLSLSLSSISLFLSIDLNLFPQSLNLFSHPQRVRSMEPSWP